MGWNANINGNGLGGQRQSPFPTAPTNLVSAFTVDTISGDLSWTDNSGGTAQYEIYSNTNGAGAVLLTTTIAGATSYIDTTCKQNASVVYSIRAKKGLLYSDYVNASALVTPLCWKSNQSTLGTITIQTLNIQAGKTVNLDFGDGNNTNYTGNNSTITHDYLTTGQYNLVLSGDIDFITNFEMRVNADKIYGNIENWLLPSHCPNIKLVNNELSGDLGKWVNATDMTICYVYSSKFTGRLPNIQSTYYYALNNYITSSELTVFKPEMTEFLVNGQNYIFPTSEIDKLLKSLADYYETNAPTQNCTFNLSGANMGIPTGGASNVDLVRLVGYYTAATKTATIIVRTS